MWLCRVLQRGFTRFYRGLLCFLCCFMGLGFKGCMGFYRVLKGFYGVLEGFGV